MGTINNNLGLFSLLSSLASATKLAERGGGLGMSRSISFITVSPKSAACVFNGD